MSRINYGDFRAHVPHPSLRLRCHADLRILFFTQPEHSGVLLFTSGATTRQLGARETGSSTPHVPHSLRNGGHTDLRVLEMFSPAILSDKVRLSDHYGRALGSVSLYE